MALPEDSQMLEVLYSMGKMKEPGRGGHWLLETLRDCHCSLEGVPSCSRHLDLTRWVIC